MPPVIKTIQDELREAHDRVTAIVATARKEDRDFSDDERTEIEGLTAKMQTLADKRQRDAGFSELLTTVSTLMPKGTNGSAPAPPAALGPYAGWAPARPRSLGQQFVEHEVYAQIRAMPRGGSWQSPPFELNAAVTIDAPAAPPANAFPPGMMIQPFEPMPTDWYVFQLFAQGTLSGSLIQYLREKVWTNAAAPVAVGGTKPESTLTFEAVNQPLIKIAHWIPVPDEFLDDIEGLRSHIDARMTQGVLEKLEDQVVNGTGLAGQMQGLLTLPNMTPPLAADPAALAGSIAMQTALVYELSRLRPDAVVMSPATWATVFTQTAGAGGYLAGSIQSTGPAPTLWGMKVVASPSIPAETAVVGAFKQGAQLYRKGGVMVQATNSHADLFIKNTTAIRAEVRAATVYYRPQAFGKITGLAPAP